MLQWCEVGVTESRSGGGSPAGVKRPLQAPCLTSEGNKSEAATKGGTHEDRERIGIFVKSQRFD